MELLRKRPYVTSVTEDRYGKHPMVRMNVRYGELPFLLNAYFNLIAPESDDHVTGRRVFDKFKPDRLFLYASPFFLDSLMIAGGLAFLLSVLLYGFHSTFLYQGSDLSILYLGFGFMALMFFIALIVEYPRINSITRDIKEAFETAASG